MTMNHTEDRTSMTTTAKVHFQFVDDSDGNQDTNSASYNDRLVLDETDLQQQRESLLSTMVSDLWKTDPEHGSTKESPIQVNMTDLVEWSFAMILAIELMYTDPRNNDNSNNENNDDDDASSTTNNNTITLPKRGVELRDLLPVLDYLGLTNRDRIYYRANVDLSHVQDIPTRIRAERYLRILKAVEELVDLYDLMIDVHPQLRSRWVIGHNGLDETEMYQINPDKMFFLCRDEDVLLYAKDEDFRIDVNQAFEARGQSTDWGESHLVVKVTGENDEIEKYATFTHLDVIVPGPPPSKKAKSVLHGSK